MKKGMLLLLSFLLATGLFAQTEYPTGANSLREMNVKGKVKRIIETTVYTDEDGEVDESEKQMKYIYDFDESGNLVREQEIDMGDHDNLNSTTTYEYKNGRLSRKNIKVRFVDPYFRAYSYGASQVTVTDEDGDTREVHFTSGGRINESRFINSDKVAYSHRYVFEYNGNGQVQKRYYKDDAEAYRKYVTSETYQYNRYGDRSRKEKFDSNGKLEWINTYDRTYGRNDNWTKCKEQFYQPGESKKDRIYSLTTRTYEYY